ncbi:hypothetical protein GOODEAATRI_018058 [Goodea atripinnis]|uniref:Secreted protein n=1 Tax=Goodea atripinnis TaxID=208336 RepID=A0ABV0MJ37_9TELE
MQKAAEALLFVCRFICRSFSPFQTLTTFHVCSSAKASSVPYLHGVRQSQVSNSAPFNGSLPPSPILTLPSHSVGLFCTFEFLLLELAVLYVRSLTTELLR